ncbi:hypothetical protein PQE75_gp129 [Bacillus phage vB_BcoS-136]|uniref:Uncharacterized protein n=1 Tax=Bacillus phage vB_BcoS-136 TaxID=2419619 RepID=A0A3G3BW18_9CAUD|nr:hypothetical protein PQE75_gp129 [Bacillus phage vB_BcoS-136]AYP68350.1 hypothetical protein vBBcoS136_00236 [Bacillus phage vB_BcoS-136]
MENKELKIKLWAVNGILQAVEDQGLELELDQLEKIKLVTGLLSKTVEAYSDILGVENEKELLSQQATEIIKDILKDL